MNFPCTHGISWGISTSVPVGQREEACFKFWYITDLTSKVMTIFSPANSIGKFLFSRWDVIGYYETCFFLPVLLRYNWHSALYKFKVYSTVVWLKFIMKWLPQNLVKFSYHLSYINNTFFPLQWELFGFTLLTIFIYNIEHCEIHIFQVLRD